MAIPTGWLCVDSTVLVEESRTLTYLRRGLGGPVHAEVKTTNTYPIGSTYLDVDNDPHTVEFFSPMRLYCWCEQGGDPAGYIDPATDDAPWYVASRPESAEFLGVLVNDLDPRSPARRSVTQLAGGGGHVGRNIPSARTVGFEGKLIASTEAGMEYGRRWVSDVLTGGLCGEGVGEVVYLPACPSDFTIDTGYRRLSRCGLVDGPDFSSIDNIGESYIMQARWQWAAGVPWLLSQPEQVGDADTVIAAGGADYFEIVADDWVGDIGVVVQIATEDDPNSATNIQVRAHPMPEGATCPDLDGDPNACCDFTITEIAPLAVAVIDSATEQAIIHGATSKAPGQAWQDLSFSGSWEWLTVPPCSSVCVKVANNGPGANVIVNVYAVNREA